MLPQNVQAVRSVQKYRKRRAVLVKEVGGQRVDKVKIKNNR